MRDPNDAARKDPTSVPFHAQTSGETTPRHLAEISTKRAEVLEQEAAVERERARRYLEAAEARGCREAGKRRASGCAGKLSAEGHGPADPQAQSGRSERLQRRRRTPIETLLRQPPSSLKTGS